MSIEKNISLILTANAYKECKIYSFKGDDFTFERNTTATRVNPSGLIEEVGDNIPRLDYSTGEGAILIEPQRTNLIVNNNGSDVYFGSFIDSTFLPNYLGNNINAYRLQVNNAGGNVHGKNYRCFDTIVFNDVNRRQLDVLVNPLENRFLKFGFFRFSNGSIGRTLIDFETLEITNINDNFDKITIDKIGDNYKISFYINTSTTVNDNVYFGVAPSNSNIDASVITGTPYIVGLASVYTEEDFSAVSYIPTNVSTVTRVRDLVPNITYSKPLINSGDAFEVNHRFLGLSNNLSGDIYGRFGALFFAFAPSFTRQIAVFVRSGRFAARVSTSNYNSFIQSDIDYHSNTLYDLTFRYYPEDRLEIKVNCELYTYNDSTLPNFEVDEGLLQAYDGSSAEIKLLSTTVKPIQN